FSIVRNGYLIDIRLLDGMDPVIVSGGDRGWPGGVFAIKFREGAHETVVEYMSLRDNELRPMGKVASNAACIFQHPEHKTMVLAVDEDKGAAIESTFEIQQNQLKKLKEVR